MQTLPTISKFDFADYSLYQTFFEECVKYSNSASLRRFEEPLYYSLSHFSQWVGNTSSIFICNRNNKNIGFIVVSLKETNQGSYLSLDFYVHPKVCKLATISLARSTAILAYFIMEKHLIPSFYTSTIHTLVFGVYNTMYDVQAFKHREYYSIAASLKTTCLDYIQKNYSQEDIKGYEDLFKSTE